MLLREETNIAAPAATVFQVFEQMDQYYTRWHPDHHAYHWLEGSQCRPGAVFRFEETIGGAIKNQTMCFTRVVPDRYLEFAPVNPVIRLLMPRLSFAMDPTGQESCLLTAKIHLRVGPLAARLNRHEFAAVRQHMVEEGLNMRQLAESGEVMAWAAS